MRQRFPEYERRTLVEKAERTLWSAEGQSHLTYLRERRHLTDEVIRQMHFGYVPSRAGHAELSGRLLMPLFDPYGRLVAITSRDISDDCPSDRKHWHESFDKSFYLYGLDTAIPGIISRQKALVVEGQFDVGYLRSIGFPFVIGVMGTALNLFQASLLSRYCTQIYLLFDGDKAGRQATERSMKMYREQKLQRDLLFVPVPTPDGKDPDDLNYPEVKDLCRESHRKVVDPGTRKLEKLIYA